MLTTSLQAPNSVIAFTDLIEITLACLLVNTNKHARVHKDLLHATPYDSDVKGLSRKAFRGKLSRSAGLCSSTLQTCTGHNF